MPASGAGVCRFLLYSPPLPPAVFFKRRQGEAIDGESHFSPPYLLIASLCCFAAPDRNTIQPMSYFKNPPRLSVSEPLAQRSPQFGRCYLNASRDFKEREIKWGGDVRGCGTTCKKACSQSVNSSQQASHKNKNRAIKPPTPLYQV